jgi:hypothetical protein
MRSRQRASLRDAGPRRRKHDRGPGSAFVNEIAGRAENVGTGRGWLLGWAGRLKACGQRPQRQLVAVHGGYPQELELRKDNECRCDRPWNLLQVQMSHGQLSIRSIRVKPRLPCKAH